jgi:hypothetical protein
LRLTSYSSKAAHGSFDWVSEMAKPIGRPSLDAIRWKRFADASTSNLIITIKQL